jgi:hypothetical protein
MELTYTVLLTGASILVTIGVTYGDLRARVNKLEKSSNGKDTFVTREEVQIRVLDAAKDHDRYDTNIKELRDRVAKLEAKMEIE